MLLLQESAADGSHGHDCILQGPSEGARKQDAPGAEGHHLQAQAVLQYGHRLIHFFLQVGAKARGG